MSWKQEKVSMPMSSAGIIGFSPDIKIGGMEIDPKLILVLTVGIVVVVKLATLLIGA